MRPLIAAGILLQWSAGHLYSAGMKDGSGRAVIVVGGGIGGLATAARLAADGLEVTVVERCAQTGGRARLWCKDGYRFDMGPSWYLMPEVFETFFARFGHTPSDFYTLRRLDPSYRVLFGPSDGDACNVPADRRGIERLFDGFERDGAAKLGRYLDAAAYKYRVATEGFLYREYRSVFDFLNWRMMTEGLRLNVLGRLDADVRRRFSDRRSRQLLEYAMVFLGTAPEAAPAMYALMSHVDLTQGVFYPLGGLSSVAQGLHKLAEAQGVRMLLETRVTRLVVENGAVCAVEVEGPDGTPGRLPCAAVVANADYAHVELDLLAPRDCSYPRRYWESRVVAPSMFLMYLGVTRRLASLEHHNLYFQPDWNRHFDTIFKRPSWPEAPCFYCSCITKTDAAMAPPGCENVFLLVPVAPGMADDDQTRERYAAMLIAHVEQMTGESIAPHIAVQRIYSQRDFTADYNAWKGTALGLSHTLMQTAVFRPAMRSRKVGNLFFAGQYTHPGIGVPMVIISAEVTADNVRGYLRGGAA